MFIVEYKLLRFLNNLKVACVAKKSDINSVMPKNTLIRHSKTTSFEICNPPIFNELILPINSKGKGINACITSTLDSANNSPSARNKKHHRAPAVLNDSNVFSKFTNRTIKPERFELPKLNLKASARTKGVGFSIGTNKDSLSPKKVTSPIKLNREHNPFSLDIPSKKERQINEMLENIVRSQIVQKYSNDSPFSKNLSATDQKVWNNRDEFLFKINDFQPQLVTPADKSLNLTSARNSQADNKMLDTKSPLKKGKHLHDLGFKDKFVRNINLNRMQSIDSELAGTEVRRQFTVRKGTKPLSDRHQHSQLEAGNSIGTKTNDLMQASTQDS